MCQLLLKTFILVFIILISNQTFAENRFQYHGNGELLLAGQKIQFRKDDQYVETGLKRINQIFTAPWQTQSEHMSLRFIELLDYVQEYFNNQNINLKSGYRSPNLNQSLRNKGKLAAQSSMHIEAAAADFFMQGIPSQKVFEFIKTLNCCGVGYYGSIHLHLDAGPARYWDQNTSKTEDQTPQLNEKIILQPSFDYYYKGEEMRLQFMRITNYPIDVATKMELVSLTTKAKSIPIEPNIMMKESVGPCWTIDNRNTAREISMTLPKKMETGTYAVKVKFCNKRNYDKMPDEILSRPFSILE